MNESENRSGGPGFSHLDESGAARMVDVSSKPETHRVATAVGRVRMGARTLALVADRALPKGDALTLARVAGILAAKRTGELIPLCHPLPLTDLQVEIQLDEDGVRITATASCVGRTGVEMEALTAVTVAALTVYDMCKSVDKRLVIEGIHLTAKSGGKSGDFRWGGPKQEPADASQ
ncbi:MAG: cyclic pyranopterin monophosphate synthase MoaC [Cytophagales bacterium]|nr:cyclic pyranopterin monophosphate synthase MoaC [Armatimonadota bacterium]